MVFACKSFLQTLKYVSTAHFIYTPSTHFTQTFVGYAKLKIIHCELRIFAFTTNYFTHLNIWMNVIILKTHWSNFNISRDLIRYTLKNQRCPGSHQILWLKRLQDKTIKYDMTQ